MSLKVHITFLYFLIIIFTIVFLLVTQLYCFLFVLLVILEHYLKTAKLLKKEQAASIQQSKPKQKKTNEPNNQ